MSSVLVVIPQPAGGLSAADGEALGAAKQIAGAQGLQLVAAVVGSGVEAAATEAAERGAERVLVADAPHLATFSGDAVVAAAAQAAQAAEASVVVVSRGQDTLELAPRLAARLGGGVVMGATELRPASDGSLEAIASVFGGSARAVYRFGAGTKVLSVGPKFTEPPARESGRTASVEKLDVPAPAPRVEVVEAAQESGPRLEDAKVVVSGGRGIQDGANFQHVRDLAAVLGGLPGASRAIVDLGWAPLAEQVGLTGKITSPDLYIAAGISGASQHMMGCSTARVLVAINTDANAQIFKYAHFGIVGDAVEVLKELTQQAKG